MEQGGDGVLPVFFPTGVNDDLPVVNRRTPFSDETQCAGIELVFQPQHSRSQGFDIVIVVHDGGRLGDDGPRVGLWTYIMHRAARKFDTGCQYTFMHMSSGEGRQQ